MARWLGRAVTGPAEHPTERIELQLELGRIDGAVRDARALVATDPNDPDSLTTLARALLAAGDVAAAEEAASSALAIAPGSIAAQATSLRTAMAADARGIRAVRQWRRTVRERTEVLAPAAAVDPAMAYLVSRGFALALRTREARSAAETAAELAPDQVWGSLALAELARDRRRPGAARTHVAEALRLDPDNRWAHLVGAEVGLGPMRQLDHMRTAAREGDARAAEVAHANSAAMVGQLLPAVGTLVAAWVGWIVALETSSALAGLATVVIGAAGSRWLATRLRRAVLRDLGSAGRTIILRSARRSLGWIVAGTLLVGLLVGLWGWPADREAATARATAWAESRDDATTGDELVVTDQMVDTALAERRYLVGVAGVLGVVAVGLPVDAWLVARSRKGSASGASGA